MILAVAILTTTASWTHVAVRVPEWGPMNMPCERWLVVRQRHSSEEKSAENWVLGYVTSYNWHVVKLPPYFGAGLSQEQVLRLVDSGCRRYRMDQLGDIAHQVIDDFEYARENPN